MSATLVQAALRRRHPDWTAERLARLQELADGDAAYLASLRRGMQAPGPPVTPLEIVRLPTGARPGESMRKGLCLWCWETHGVRSDGTLVAHGPLGDRCLGSGEQAGTVEGAGRRPV